MLEHIAPTHERQSPGGNTRPELKVLPPCIGNARVEEKIRTNKLMKTGIILDDQKLEDVSAGLALCSHLALPQWLDSRQSERTRALRGAAFDTFRLGLVLRRD